MRFFRLMRSAPLALTVHVERLKRLYLALLAIAIVVLALFWGVFLAAPSGFPSGQVLEIAQGTSISKAATELAGSHAIAHPLLFKALAKFMPGAHGVQSGKYEFKEPAGVLTVAWNLTHGISGLPRARVTFPEGTTARQMGNVLAAALPGFDAERFDSLAIPHEGYLFPDTYYFLPDTTEEAAVEALEENYRTHIAKYADRIAASGHTERDIITMASILEGEGKTLEDKRIIAGILWHRIAIGMPLQVDAPFGYEYGLTGYTPTASDLKSASGYNTYRYKGLPQTPINNPGDVSIEAALSPETTDYLYYLTGTDGQMHYAKTFAEHVANQKLYLK